jgi:hypothetical protein
MRVVSSTAGAYTVKRGGGVFRTTPVSGGTAPEVIVPPSIEQGSRTTGATLTIDTGVFTPTPTSYTYQWYRDGASIGGATSSTYVLTASDEGARIACVVTPINNGTPGTAFTTRPTEGVDGTKTSPSVEWIEDVATDAKTSGGSDTVPSTDWGGHQTKIVVMDDGTPRVLYSRTVSTVDYARVMKRTGTNTWSQDGEVAISKDNFLLRDPLTNATYLVAWQASAPVVYVGPTFGTSYSLSGSWSTREHGGAGIGPDGTVVVTEWDHKGAAPTENQWERWNSVRRYNGTFTPSGFVDISLAALPITPNGERFAYVFVAPYSSSGIGAGLSDRMAVGFSRDAVAGASEDDARRLWHIKVSDGSGAATREVVFTLGTDYGGHDDMIVDHLGRVWTAYRRTDTADFYVQIHNLDGSITTRMGETHLSNITGTAGRIKLAQDSRGRVWVVRLTQAASPTMEIMQLSVSGTEPNGTLTLTQGSLVSLSGAWSGIATSSVAWRIGGLRAGSPIDNRLYGYTLRNGNATITAFCIHLPD